MTNDDSYVKTFLQEISRNPSLLAITHPPVPLEPPPELDILEWAPPSWLALIYEHHAAIGLHSARAGWARPTLLPWSEVRPLTAFIRFGEENITFDPADSVLLTPDDRLGGIVLCDRTQPTLRAFNGLQHGLSPPMSVEAYLQGLITDWTATLSSPGNPWL